MRLESQYRPSRTRRTRALLVLIGMAFGLAALAAPPVHLLEWEVGPNGSAGEEGALMETAGQVPSHTTPPRAPANHGKCLTCMVLTPVASFGASAAPTTAPLLLASAFRTHAGAPADTRPVADARPRAPPAV
jgi:hypothetical protein